LSRADADDFTVVSAAGSSGGFSLDDSCEEISAAQALSLLESVEEVEAVLEGECLSEEGAMIGCDGVRYFASAWGYFMFPSVVILLA
jgi:hypothetical protein